ncbi:MAG: Nucleotide sugar dehydrogenase [Candidatus Magasanikbacteria bacterium GW2011_GWD2_43_18]|uniref:Nucleotide sugar dehydrogenase n=1 Tax=Candidatus Magasanikbacteria bacterium GW2011_GWE2_42_7 TaxID=1619052 RepID=A0A0G1BGV2_9BACT|nr:MAG: Nucleotide sugar dehydrogenase [Candidatus Magasanikbacteria bacterium GW2011_GWC2_42_27]KKS72557.1 MAG: Nucleotide sugar dehydrogenase [Candidatus Magasanikbacteria bacterium GW2011_GWE2_42_7]KKT05263.1 MAG: Nucleotide sugar dehydrogenase [Candidatus Magasanikbacteria bacterium GW2011_GWD2_43_18]KKT26115.1 MAG: Nucleotide sugar dehydrogenase [Candidatus Magasanikbacteria bacterium GW2011_GWA2_43_9]
MRTSTQEEFMNGQRKICVVGLGYVGLPLAVLLSKKFQVIGFDINEHRVEQLVSGTDVTKEVDDIQLAQASIEYTSDPARIKDASFIIVAVPTPVDGNNIPDLTIVKKASSLVGTYLQKGSVVVYESTVYPGVTEEICVPLLASTSGYVYGEDFFVGYSPERVNPGDKEHTIDKITKVVSGTDAHTVELIASIYGAITQTFIAASIQVAEAAKVIENTQRDLNIALMNELAILFSKMGISIYDVLSAAGTKWNFLPFKPGLVGGHCIGVDPYYLTYKATEVGHRPEVILAGRGQNDSMHKFVAHEIIKKMVQQGKDVSSASILILGATFKENIPDIRNSKNIALYKELQDFGIHVFLHDPLANTVDVEHEYGISLSHLNEISKVDTVIVAVPHDAYMNMDMQEFVNMTHEHALFADIKHVFDKEKVETQGLTYWTL